MTLVDKASRSPEVRKKLATAEEPSTLAGLPRDLKEAVEILGKYADPSYAGVEMGTNTGGL